MDGETVGHRGHWGEVSPSAPLMPIAIVGSFPLQERCVVALSPTKRLLPALALAKRAAPPACARPQDGPDRLRKRGPHGRVPGRIALVNRMRRPLHRRGSHRALAGLRLFRGGARPASGNEIDDARRGAADYSQHRQFAGAVGQDKSLTPLRPRRPDARSFQAAV
jgi:hypothetical protein